MLYKLTLFVILCLFFALPAQNSMLIDCVHGVDSYFIENVMYNIQFDEIFPDYQVTTLTANDIQWTEILIEEQVTGDDIYNFSIDLPASPQYPIALYVIVTPLSNPSPWGITGEIISPEEIIEAELYHGIGHVDLASGADWEIEIELSQSIQYNIKIGYGPLLLQSSLYTGIYNLSDYDLLLRIKNDEYFPFLGKYEEYSNPDLVALEEAFDDGLACLNNYNIFCPYVDKPYVHFYADEDISVDYSVCFLGKETLTKPDPKIENSNWRWDNLQLDRHNYKEIIYEGIYYQPLNFLKFSGTNSNPIISNQIEYPIYDLHLIRFKDEKYQYQYLSKLEGFETNKSNETAVFTGKELKKILKNGLIKEALAVGLYEYEAESFINNYNWVESILHRARDNEDCWFGIYRFDKQIYNGLFPAEIKPAPTEISRNMWVMLSNINTAYHGNPAPLFQEVKECTTKADFRIHEYGFIDEYYSTYSGSREDEFFGVTLNEWIISFAQFNLMFYDNIIANEINPGLGNISSLMYLNFDVEDYQQCGILYEDYNPQYPVASAHKIGDHGRLIMLGSCQTFDNEPINNAFLRNCTDALLNSEYFTGSSETEIPENNELRICAYPNPFVTSGLRGNGVTIEFNTAENNCLTTLNVYNLKGQRVKCLVNEKLETGKHVVNWNGSDEFGNDVATGIYLYRLKSGSKNQTKKVVKMQ